MMEYENLLTDETNQRKMKVNQKKSIYQRTFENDENDQNMELRKRIASLEMDLAQKNSGHNGEVTKLHEQITKLRCAFEKNELLRQKLEYELTISKNDENKRIRDLFTQKDDLRVTIDSLNGKILTKDEEMNSMQNILDEQKNLFESTKVEMNAKTHALELANTELKKENEVLYEEKLASEKLVSTWKGKFQEVEDKCLLLEEQRSKHTDTIHKLMKDLEYSNTKEEELLSMNKDLIDKVKNVESSKEEERAAHLETKFTLDVLQLKLRDTESLLQTETARYNESKNSVDSTNTKYRELDSALMSEKQAKNHLEARYNHLDDSHKKLTEEYNAKSKMVEDLSSEIKAYHSEVEALTDQLSKNNEKLSGIEIDKINMTKEMTYLLNNYEIISEDLLSPDNEKSWNFTELMKQVGKILEDYQKKILDKEKQVQEGMCTFQNLQKEYEDYKSIELSKDCALQEAERLVQSAQNDMKKYQMKCATSEEKLKKIKEDRKQLEEVLLERNERIQCLSQQFSKLSIDKENVEKTYHSSLQNIYNLLITGTNQLPDRQFNFTFSELKNTIMNLLEEDIHNIKLNSEKLSDVQTELVKTKDELLRYKEYVKQQQKIFTQNEQMLANTRGIWEKEKADLEKKHSIELTKVQEDVKKSEMLRSDVLLKEKDILSKLQEKTHQNTKLSKAFHKIEYENGLSTITMSIFIGALQGLLTRQDELVQQKHMFLLQLEKLTKLKDGVVQLADTLQSEMENSQSSSYHVERKSGILYFRVIVLAVLVSNRFKKLSTCSKSLSTRHAVHSHRLCFPVKSEVVLESSSEKIHHSKLFEWLRNRSLQKQLLQHVKQISSLAKDDTDSGLPHMVGTTYIGFLETLKKEYQPHLLVYTANKDSLISHLWTGLKKILSEKEKLSCPYISASNALSDLQRFMLRFTHRLHDAEVVRRAMTVEVEKYQEKQNQMRMKLQTVSEENDTLERKLKISEEQATTMVDEKQFNDACVNLKDSLKREEELIALLQHQKDDIESMNERIEKHESTCKDKESRITKAAEKMKQQDGHIKELHQQFIRLQQENQKYQKVNECRSTELSKYAKEREALAKYLRNVSSALNESKRQVHFHGNHPSKFDSVLPEMILPNELLALDGFERNVDLQICQDTVKIFIDSQREALQQIVNLRAEKQVIQYRMYALEDDVTRHKQRIQKLKEQVSAACQEVTPPDVVSNASKERADGFMPLTQQNTPNFLL